MSDQSDSQTRSDSLEKYPREISVEQKSESVEVEWSSDDDDGGEQVSPPREDTTSNAAIAKTLKDALREEEEGSEGDENPSPSQGRLAVIPMTESSFRASVGPSSSRSPPDHYIDPVTKKWVTISYRNTAEQEGAINEKPSKAFINRMKKCDWPIKAAQMAGLKWA